jgi:hypothetical protein
MTSDIALSGAACTLDVMPRQLVQAFSENDSRKRAVSLCADAVASMARGPVQVHQQRPGPGLPQQAPHRAVPSSSRISQQILRYVALLRQFCSPVEA